MLQLAAFRGKRQTAGTDKTLFNEEKRSLVVKVTSCNASLCKPIFR